MNGRRYHGRHLRMNRYSLVGHAYLVTACCNMRKPIFRNIDFGNVIVDEIKKSDSCKRTLTYAYVVMPDHLHWLFQLQKRNSVSSVVRRIKGGSAYRINKMRGRRGSIWQSGFHDRLIKSEESLETVGNYVIHNPVRAGMVASVDEYPLWHLMWTRYDLKIRG